MEKGLRWEIIGLFAGLFIFSTRPVYAVTPRLKIVSPTQSQTIVGNEVTVSFIVGEVEFGKSAHLHLWLDDASPSEETATEITSHLDHVLSGLSPGQHLLTLEVVTPDHASFHPPVKKSVEFVFLYPQESASATQNADKSRGTWIRAAESIRKYHREAAGVIGGCVVIAIGIAIRRRRKQITPTPSWPEV